jgi:hypothetical protein
LDIRDLKLIYLLNKLIFFINDTYLLQLIFTRPWVKFRKIPPLLRYLTVSCMPFVIWDRISSKPYIPECQNQAISFIGTEE